MDITTIIDKQRQYYESESTMSYRFRLEALKKLKQGLIKHQKAFEEALYKDLNKSPIESYFAEIGLTLKEITHQEKHLKRYMKNRPVKTSLTDFHAKSYISPHPYGVTLIMSPWNYPLMLTLCPLAGAIAAGNTCIVKPSDYSHHTSLALKAMIEDTFPEEYVALVTGGRSENQTLLDQKFDYIFFTGSKQVGQIVMERASRHLTPISLELGGKSPCIVDRSSSLKIAARRIAFGKYLNAGQTCVAPDYVLIDETVKDEFIGYFKSAIADTFGNDPLESELLVKIINTKHFDRLKNLLDNQKIAIGGKYNADTLKIEPTVIDDVFEDNVIMDDEIFGPILPIMTFKEIEEAHAYINRHPKPLALYLFTNDKANQKATLRSCNFGGGCINDVVVHVASDSLPFGGVGESGMGNYHGKASFDTFTHYRSILHKANWLDTQFRYAPYTKIKEKIIKIFLR